MSATSFNVRRFTSTGTGRQVVEDIPLTSEDFADSETILVAGAISLLTRVTKLSAASGAYAVTLAAPTTPGMVKVIDMTVAGNAITLALTNVQGGTAATSASFDAVNECLVLVSGAGKWMVVGQAGVTLS